MDLNSIWTCSNPDCDFTEKAKSIEDYVMVAEMDIAGVKTGGVLTYEDLLNQYSQKLYPNHYISKDNLGLIYLVHSIQNYVFQF